MTDATGQRHTFWRIFRTAIWICTQFRTNAWSDICDQFRNLATCREVNYSNLNIGALSHDLVRPRTTFMSEISCLRIERNLPAFKFRAVVFFGICIDHPTCKMAHLVRQRIANAVWKQSVELQHQIIAKLVNYLRSQVLWLLVQCCWSQRLPLTCHRSIK